MPMKNMIKTFLIMILILSSGFCLASPRVTELDPLATQQELPVLLKTKVIEFHADNVSAIDCIRALGAHFNFHYAIEALTDSADTSEEMNKNISFSVDNDTLSNVLDRITNANPSLQWTIRGDTITVKPKGLEKTKLSTILLSKYKVENVPFNSAIIELDKQIHSVDPNFLIFITLKFTPQLTRGGTALFTIDENDVTLETILDILAHRLGCSWSANYSKSYQRNMVSMDSVELIPYTNPNITIEPIVPHAVFGGGMNVILDESISIKKFAVNQDNGIECLRQLAYNLHFNYGIENIKINQDSPIFTADSINKKLSVELVNTNLFDVLSTISNQNQYYRFSLYNTVEDMYPSFSAFDKNYPFTRTVHIDLEDKTVPECLHAIAECINNELGSNIVNINKIDPVVDRRGNPIRLCIQSPKRSTQKLLSVRDLLNYIAYETDQSWEATQDKDKINIDMITLGEKVNSKIIIKK